MKLRFAAISALIILAPVKSYPGPEENLYFSQISTTDGLTHNTVRCILVDRTGFVWAGTVDGLNRYDGYRIVRHKPRQGDPNSLHDHRIRDIFEDRDGYIWIKSYAQEFSCYDPVHEKYIDYMPRPGMHGRLSYNAFYEASNGDIWLWGNETGSERHGCMRIRKTPDGLESAIYFHGDEERSGERCRFLFEDSEGFVWTGTGSGLYRIRHNGQADIYFARTYTFNHATELDGILYFATSQGAVIEFNPRRDSFREVPCNDGDSRLLQLAVMSENELMIATEEDGVLRYNVDNGRFDKLSWAADPQLSSRTEMTVDGLGGIWISNQSGNVWYYDSDKRDVRKFNLIPAETMAVIDYERYVFFTDSRGEVWITTYGSGLYNYDPATGRLTNYCYKSDSNSPFSDYLLSITEDNFGNIWVGSEYAGIIKVARSFYDVDIVRPEPASSVGRNNNIRSIHTDSYGNIWVGTKNGNLYVYDSHLENKKTVMEDINPYCFEEDARNRLWVGTKGNGLYFIDLDTRVVVGHLTEPGTDEQTVLDNTYFDLFRDSQGRMWAGSFGGGLALAEDTSDGGIELRRLFRGQGNRSYIRHMYETNDGEMWVGTSDGIVRFRADEILSDEQSYVSHSLDLSDPGSISCNDIKTIFEDSRGIIWIGTAGGGMNRYVPASGNEKEYFISFTVEHGLAGDYISGILEDRRGNLWVSSESGISRYDVSNEDFTSYNFSEKPSGNLFNENACIYTRNGYMMWGSLDGMVVFNPESFEPDMTSPPVVFTGLSVSDRRVLAGRADSPLESSVTYSREVKLRNDDNSFTLEFSTLAVGDPLKTKYSYILEGYDRDWSYANSANSASYKNIPPGKYLFKVRGTNREREWNDEFTTLAVRIFPPWWASIYAYLAYILLAAGALYFAYRLVRKFNTLNNNITLERELTSHKLRFFTNISHEFRTPLTLIKVAVENLNSEQNVPENISKQVGVISRNSSSLSRLIDQLLEFRKLQNNVLRLDLEATDIIRFGRDIYESFSELATKKSITYRFLSNIDSNHIYIDRKKVDKIIYNLLNNAFKFTPNGGKITIEIKNDPDKQLCTIQVGDTGIGIDREKQHLLFSRFMQINFSSSGTGVGLSLVKEFVEVHKGRIWYEQNGKQGSVFNVELPTNPEVYKNDNIVENTDTMPADEHSGIDHSNIVYPNDPTVEVKLPEIADSTLSNFKILVIDDNDSIRDMLTEEFSNYFTVNTAEDGKKGLQKAIELNPDLIVCDVMMPEMDGFEVTRRLKGEFQTCHIPIILLTAHTSLEHQIEGIQSGADAYIMKPFSMKYLMSRVFKLIEQQEQLKKRFSGTALLERSLLSNSDKDKSFFTLIDNILDKHISEPDFSVDKFAQLAKMRRTIFYKKVKGVTGLSPNELIKVKRLKLAAELLLQGELTVSEVSYKVGYDDPFYFSKCFKKQFGCPPSKFGKVVPSGARD